MRIITLFIPLSTLLLAPVLAQIAVGGVACSRSCVDFNIGNCDGVVKCACEHEDFINLAIDCFRKSCTTDADIRSSINETVRNCKNVGVEIFLQSPLAISPITDKDQPTTSVGGPVKTKTADSLTTTPASTTSSSTTVSSSPVSSSTTDSTPTSASAATEESGTDNSKLAVGLGAGLGVTAVLALVFGFFLLKRRRKKRAAKGEKATELDAEGNPKELDGKGGTVELDGKDGAKTELDGSEVTPVYEVNGAMEAVEMPGDSIPPAELQGNDRFKN